VAFHLVAHPFRFVASIKKTGKKCSNLARREARRSKRTLQQDEAGQSGFDYFCLSKTESHMMKIHNFSAGPAILPQSVMEQAAQGVLNLNNSGLSILEISHRSKDFTAIIEETETSIRELYQIPDTYAVLFLSGGASTQFFMVPMNILANDEVAAYADTGSWSSKAIKEAKAFGTIKVVATSKPENYSHIPVNYEIPAEARYLHITTNNTIFGTQYHQLPATDIPLVADMSSDFLSEPIDINRFDVVYAGAQKNLGPAGVTVVIIKKEILNRTGRELPTMLNYQTHVEGESLYNTPPVFPIYVSMLTLRWIKEQGGLSAIKMMNERKAALLYDEIDRNPLFIGTARKEDRSLMNVTFLLKDSSKEEAFLQLCKSKGISGIKGHRSVGGFRASIYNAMPVESVQVLIDAMQEFSGK